MRKIILLIAIAFWSIGQCASWGNDYKDWKASVNFYYSQDGLTWPENPNSLMEISTDDVLYVRIESTVKTDYLFESTVDKVPITLEINFEKGCSSVSVNSGNGSFSWDKKNYSGKYKFHAIANKLGDSTITVLKFKGINPGEMSISVKYENKLLQERFKYLSRITITPFDKK